MRRKVLQLAEEGRQLHYEDELDDAIDRYELACVLVRESIGKQKDKADPDSLQQLGSMLYAQGEWLVENGEYQTALDALAEAEQSYARLGPRVPAQLISDVVLRRARVLMAAGRRLSAMAEAQRAMIRALEPVASDTRGLGPQVIDAARVLAHGGAVQLGSGGDPTWRRPPPTGRCASTWARSGRATSCRCRRRTCLLWRPPRAPPTSRTPRPAATTWRPSRCS